MKNNIKKYIAAIFIMINLLLLTGCALDTSTDVLTASEINSSISYLQDISYANNSILNAISEITEDLNNQQQNNETNSINTITNTSTPSSTVIPTEQPENDNSANTTLQNSPIPANTKTPIVTPVPTVEATPVPTPIPTPKSTPKPTQIISTPVPTAKPIKQTPIQTQSQSISSRSYTYVLNTNTKKFHYLSCSSVKQIKSHNYSEYTGTRQEVINRGYVPCKKCNP